MALHLADAQPEAHPLNASDNRSVPTPAFAPSEYYPMLKSWDKVNLATAIAVEFGLNNDIEAVTILRGERKLKSLIRGAMNGDNLDSSLREMNRIVMAGLLPRVLVHYER